MPAQRPNIHFGAFCLIYCGKVLIFNKFDVIATDFQNKDRIDGGKVRDQSS